MVWSIGTSSAAPDAGTTDELLAAYLQNQRAKSLTLAQQLQQTGTSTAPVYSTAQGIARALTGALGGWTAYKDAQDAAAANAANTKELADIARQAGSNTSLPSGLSTSPPSGSEFSGGSDKQAFADPEDKMAKTIVAEAGNQGPVGMAAVGHVIKNRADLSGKDTDAVIDHPRAFEGYENGNAARVSRDSPAYQQARAIVAGIKNGTVPDPTGGATHFWSPSGQSAAGRAPPSWAAGLPAQKIGGHLFYRRAGDKFAEGEDAGTSPQLAGDSMSDASNDPAVTAAQAASASVAPALDQTLEQRGPVDVTGRTAEQRPGDTDNLRLDPAIDQQPNFGKGPILMNGAGMDNMPKNPPLPPPRPADLAGALSAPLPPPRPADLGGAPPATLASALLQPDETNATNPAVAYATNQRMGLASALTGQPIPGAQAALQGGPAPAAIAPVTTGGAPPDASLPPTAPLPPVRPADLGAPAPVADAGAAAPTDVLGPRPGGYSLPPPGYTGAQVQGAEDAARAAQDRYAAAHAQGAPAPGAPAPAAAAPETPEAGVDNTETSSTAPVQVAQAGPQTANDATRAAAATNAAKDTQIMHLIQIAQRAKALGQDAQAEYAMSLAKRLGAEKVTVAYDKDGNMFNVEASGRTTQIRAAKEDKTKADLWTDPGSGQTFNKKIDANGNITLTPATVNGQPLPGAKYREPTAEEKQRHPNWDMVNAVTGEPKYTPQAAAVVNNQIGKEEGAEAKKAGESAGARRDAMVAAADAAPERIGRIKLLQSALDQVQTGKLAPYQATVAGWARAIGAPDGLLEGLGLDPKLPMTSDIAQKVVGELVKEQIGAKNGGFPASNFSKAELQYINGMFPNIQNQPGSNALVADTLIASEQRKLDKADAWSEYKDKQRAAGKSTSFEDFEDDWRREHKNENIFAPIIQKYRNGEYPGMTPPAAAGPPASAAPAAAAQPTPLPGGGFLDPATGVKIRMRQ